MDISQTSQTSTTPITADSAVDGHIPFHGRKVIKTDPVEVTDDNVVSLLTRALSYHNVNRSEIQYLWNYYRGIQPVWSRKKEVRPEICNKVVENRASEIVAFKTGYLMGEPIQYVSHGKDDSIGDAIQQLNEYLFAEEKSSKDKELADWFHICGTSFRMILPNQNPNLDEDESPFEIYTLDPRWSFVVYSNALGNEPLMGVTYYVDEDVHYHYSIYTKDHYFEIIDSALITSEPHMLGQIPILEYPLNQARIGAFEVVLPLLDAINLTESNRLDGVEQFIQSLLLFHNTKIDDELYAKLREEGAIAYSDIDPSMKAEITYLTQQLDQSQTQTLVDHMYQSVLEICGMPNRNGGSSTSDTGSAVIMRDGWSDAEARAKDAELCFKKSERKFVKLALSICHAYSGMNESVRALKDLKPSNIDIRFTRRNYENILQKAQVLTEMLNSSSIDPKLAFEHCGMFIDPDLAYAMSMQYKDEQEKKQLEQAQQMAAQQQGTANGTGDNTGSDNGNPRDSQAGQQGGDPHRAGQNSGD